MFEKFGEFDSFEEINRAAAAQLKEGDIEAVMAIAEENGLDREVAEDFCCGAIDELTTASLAAVGKLDAEAKELQLKGMMLEDRESVVEGKRVDLGGRRIIQKKGKRMEQGLGEILKARFRVRKHST